LLKRTLSTKAYTFLLGDTTAKCQDILEGMRQRGELPTGIKKTFVEDLLNQKRCICGAELTDGSHAYHLVQAWMEKAGIADIEETAIRLTAQTDELKRQETEFWEITDREQANLTQWRTELSQIETELDNIRNKLISYPDIDIQQLQKRLDSLDSKINELQRETGANQQKLEMLNSDIEKAIKQVAKQQMNEERQALAQRRIQATQEAIERIGEVKNRLEKQFRSSLEKRVQEIFSQISFTPYLPKLSEKYELSLVEKTSLFELPVAASTGENQILCLSFIGGIIDRVREWSQSRLHLGPNSSTFPVVMDSPFGSLDEIYRRQVAKSLPQLANQLIVLVTKTQWRGEVETEMNPRIGKEYILVYHSPKPNCEEDWLERQGERYALVRQSSHEFEYTEIVEIPRRL
ncbi:MAG: ATP-binding protein, partial [Desertifilum sp. SIO1I2]|nr:ATP-binding protein [Desertifilum sp. SIO1I2]